ALLARAELGLLGNHNVANALAAALAVREAGVPSAAIGAGLRSFRALPHRLEPVRDVGGVHWINDSKATNIASTVVAVEAMDRPFVLLLGGRHKGEPYTRLAPMLREKCRLVIAYGESGELIERDLGGKVPLERGTTFEDVVARARGAARPGVAVLLLLPLLPFTQAIAPNINGARRWVNLGFVTVQPSELAKFAVVVWTAMLAAKKGERIRTFQYGLLPFLVVLVPLVALIFLEPNLSMAVLVTLLAGVVLFTGGARIGHFLTIAVVATPILFGAVASAQYRLARVVTFLNPGSAPSEATWQVHQSLVGMGAGRLFGVGLGQGQQKLGYLPYAYSDFIFSTIGEEWGFLGVLALIVLFGTFAWLAFRIPPSAFRAAMRIVLTGGGTGGHLMPALALAHALRQARPDIEPVLVGAERGIEAQVLPRYPFRYHLLPMEPIYRRTWWNNVRALVTAGRAWRAAGRVLDAEQPVIVVGTGGY